MSEPMVFVPMNVVGMTDAEIGESLKRIGDDFPFGGDKYAEQILAEAISRIHKAEEEANR